MVFSLAARENNSGHNELYVFELGSQIANAGGVISYHILNCHTKTASLSLPALTSRSRSTPTHENKIEFILELGNYTGVSTYIHIVSSS